MNIDSKLIYSLFVVGLLISAAFIAVRDKKGGIVPMILKAVSSVFFIAVSIAAALVVFNEYVIANASSLDKKALSKFITFIFLFTIAGICSLLGDIFLDLKPTYVKDNDMYLSAGMVAFSIAHVFYFSALILLFGFQWIALIIAIIVGLASFVLNKYVAKLNMGKFSALSTVYATLLMYTLCQAAYIACVGKSKIFGNLLAVGAALFAVSDLILSQTYFNGKDSKFMIAINHITYYVGQFLMALSLLFIKM